MYEIKKELKVFFLKLIRNKILFVYPIIGVSSDVAKLCGYFQSVKRFKFGFSGKAY